MCVPHSLRVGTDDGAQAKWNDTECSFQETLAAAGPDVVRPTRQEEDKAAQETKESQSHSAAPRGRPPQTGRPLPHVQVQL